MGTKSPASQTLRTSHLTDDRTVEFLVLFIFLMNLWSKMCVTLENLFHIPNIQFSLKSLLKLTLLLKGKLDFEYCSA